MQYSRAVIRQLVPQKNVWRPSDLTTRRTFSYAASRWFLSSTPRPNSSHTTSLDIIYRYDRRFNSSDAPNRGESFPDPSRPDLFYHLIQPPTPTSKTLPAYALSYLQEKPPTSSSATIIGWLPAQGRGNERNNGTDPKITSGNITLEDFVSNSKFLDILHSAIKDGLKEGVDEIQKATAIQTMDGWMHIHGMLFMLLRSRDMVADVFIDQRNIPALNRIGDPDDIIGTVLVENSEILPETYQPMLAYRLVTSDGLMQLTPGLAKKLQDTLAVISNAERASMS
ncbi:hypothetical protein P691DRAFT_699271 [Macrolepiota fuliginosa MF-IS2]|uniref:Uncharacterized protein n=1 Tax=Macrolepiota fuliginosa MF-IS2 TaxID=1400762 RepID=A0A9P6C7M5_9AGAR|nr:hypothetical protein P691DRAFT_699271 [Macrolepiota fuliginosa MF-IS2]